MNLWIDNDMKKGIHVQPNHATQDESVNLHEMAMLSAGQHSVEATFGGQASSSQVNKASQSLGGSNIWPRRLSVLAVPANPPIPAPIPAPVPAVFCIFPFRDFNFNILHSYFL